MYIVTMAARISQSSLLSDALNARAAPWKLIWTLSGSARACLADSIAFTASPSEAPGARLNEIVATGNWPMWLMATAAGFVSKRAKLLSGMICSRVPESVETGIVVPGVDCEDDAAEVADAVPPVVCAAA